MGKRQLYPPPPKGRHVFLMLDNKRGESLLPSRGLMLDFNQAPSPRGLTPGATSCRHCRGLKISKVAVIGLPAI